jgi:hypothetical protein
MLRRLILVLSVAIVAQALLGQVPTKSTESPDKTKKPPGNCSVSGRVVNAADGAPLGSARVGLIQANERKHPLVYAATTDDQGRFELNQIEAGRYEFLPRTSDTWSSNTRPRFRVGVKAPRCR